MAQTLFPILYSTDLPAALRFYRDGLGMKITFQYPDEGEPGYVTLELGGATLGLGTYDPTPGLEARNLERPQGGRGFELCIYVPEVDRAVEQLRALGARVLIEPRDMPWGERLAYVEDPDGNTLMLTAAAVSGSG